MHLAISARAEAVIERSKPHMNPRPKSYWVIISLLASQVMLVNNATTGMLILTAICFPSLVAGAHGMLGLLGATLLAMALRLDAHALQSGLFGYNGLLVGMASAAFLVHGGDDGWSVPVLMAVLVVGAMSTIFQLALGNALVPVFKSPPFTLAFNVSNMILLLAAPRLSSLQVAPGLAPRLPATDAAPAAPLLDAYREIPSGLSAVVWLLEAALTSVWQVFLCESCVSGALILLGVA